MAGETEMISNAWPIRFSAGGQAWAVRQPTCEERDDARSIYRLYEALWAARPEVQALIAVKPSAEELTVFDNTITAAQELLAQAEHPAAQAALQRRIVALQRQKQTWTRAQELTAERAALARDRWLTIRLLLEPTAAGGWRPVFDPQDPADAEKWEAFDETVRDAARPALWAALRLVEDGRFFSAPRSAPD